MLTKTADDLRRAVESISKAVRTPPETAYWIVKPANRFSQLRKRPYRPPISKERKPGQPSLSR